MSIVKSPIRGKPEADPWERVGESWILWPLMCSPWFEVDASLSQKINKQENMNTVKSFAGFFKTLKKLWQTTELYKTELIGRLNLKKKEKFWDEKGKRAFHTHTTLRDE